MDQPIMYFAAWTSIIIAIVFTIAAFIVMQRNGKKHQITKEQVFIAFTGQQLLKLFDMKSGEPLKVVNISRVQDDRSVDILFETEDRDYNAVFDLYNPKNSFQIGKKQSLTITFTDEFLNNPVGMQQIKFVYSRSTVEKIILDPKNILSMTLTSTKALQ